MDPNTSSNDDLNSRTCPDCSRKFEFRDQCMSHISICKFKADRILREERIAVDNRIRLLEERITALELINKTELNPTNTTINNFTINGDYNVH